MALCIVVLIALVAYAMYCRRKLKKYQGTGRVAEIDKWYLKSIIAWILALLLVGTLVIKLSEG